MAIKALVQNPKGFTTLSQEGEFWQGGNYNKLAENLGLDIALVCYRKTFRNLPIKAIDILELFAFIYPAQFCIPSVKGLCSFLKLSEPVNSYEESERLFIIMEHLLEKATEDDSCYGIAKHMAEAGWIFGGLILERFTRIPKNTNTVMIWQHLEDLKDSPPSDKNIASHTVTDAEIDRRLEGLGLREKRQEQHDYAKFANRLFSPLKKEGDFNLLLSEAGTGTGKTLGYLVPAYLWAKKNDSSVWISTYTKALQNQVYNELDKIFPDKEDKLANVVIRKGRENYLCLLNFEDALKKVSTVYAVLAGLIARYVIKTNDGDLNGPEFPGWIEDLVGYEALSSITDRRGECLFGACPYYRKCFIEKNIAKAKDAQIVITNHALLMNIAQKDAGEDSSMPRHYIFDEGHHVFDAADNAFSACLSVMECYELRKWVLGPEESRKTSSRMRGLKRRYEDLIGTYSMISESIIDICDQVAKFPKYGAVSRIRKDENSGVIEDFFAAVYSHIRANSNSKQASYSEIYTVNNPGDEIIALAKELTDIFAKIKSSSDQLLSVLERILSKDAATLEASQKSRIESTMKSIKNRISDTMLIWMTMLQSIIEGVPDGYIDFMEITKGDDIIYDIAIKQHFVDPSIAFALTMKRVAKGILVTSATLKDRRESWDFSYNRIGVSHFETEAQTFASASPFDYKNLCKILIISDVNKNNPSAIASAYRELFLSSGGGALGIFTAISRLKYVYKHIREALLNQGIPLLSQHIDDINTSALIDIFRNEEHSCLLGTDAIRDGIDVPGRPLRLITFDRVPWPRSDILYKERKSHQENKSAYDYALTRAKLAQGFGRLIRKKDDKGVFVILERATPSELLSAFPEGAEIIRTGLKNSVEIIRDFMI